MHAREEEVARALEQRLHDIERLRSHGLTWRQVGAWMHMRQETVRRFYAAVTGAADRTVRERSLRAVELRRRGLKWSEVGARLGCGAARAHVIWKRGIGIARRRAEAGIL